MCGICGFAGVDDNNLLDKMIESLGHRGPDSNGKYNNKKFRIGLGHNRLGIIDLKGGNQPLFNEDKSVCLVCNGIIYNFKELRDELRDKGHIFYTQTDSEVIIHLYEEKGEKCVDSFNGKFAFALWDERKKKLFIARDRLGICPLYYTVLNGCFLFASEIKAILQSFLVKRDPDFLSLDAYLSFRYVPGPRTMFKGILELLPGCVLIYQNGKVKIDRYWDVRKKLNRSGSEEEYYELLVDSVRKRLLSDVPVGMYLSGGIDSTAILSLMNGFTKPVKTFSIGFESGPDELEQAREISLFYKTQHQEVIVKEKEFQLLPEIVKFLDNPLGDAIVIPLYYLSKLAKQSGVKVILTGDGADELLGGYVHHFVFNYLELYKKSVPDFVQINLINKFMQIIPLKVLDFFFPYPASLGQEGRSRFLGYLGGGQNRERFYFELLSLFTSEDKKKLYTKELFDEIETSKREVGIDFTDGFKKKENNTFLQNLIFWDLANWLPHNILFKNDRMAMANSVECRVPFLDHRLVEFSLNLRDKDRINGLVNKCFLRKAMKNYLPEKVVKRKKKAFYFPVNRYFKGKFKNDVESVLSSTMINQRGYFNYNFIENILKKRQDSPLIYDKQIMALTILELWNQAFLT